MKGVDLNLLIIFDAIMVENAISGAAERLGMTQPAVSNAVGRMRQVWNDPLFVKDGRGIRPTARALSLWDQIHGALDQLKVAVDPPEFNPATCARRFRVATTDIMVDLVWPVMRQLIEREAPNIELHAVPYRPDTAGDLLANAEADLVITVLDEFSGNERSEVILQREYVIAMRSGHPLANEPLTLEHYLAADHLVVSLSGDPRSFVDDLLQQQGLSRRVAMTVNHFSALPRMLNRTNLIAMTVNTVIAEDVLAGKLVVKAPPFKVDSADIAIGWHPRNDSDPGVAWLRHHLVRLARAQWKRFSPYCSACRGQGDGADNAAAVALAAGLAPVPKGPGR